MAALKIALAQLVICTLFEVIGINGKPPTAVSSGYLADDSEFPYQVLLSIFGGHACGGTTIDSRHILTVALCVYNIYYAINEVLSCSHTKLSTEHRPAVQYPHALADARVLVSDLVRFPIDSEIGKRCFMWEHLYPNGKISTGFIKLSTLVVPNSRCTVRELADVHETHICAYSSRATAVAHYGHDGTLVGIASFVVPCAMDYPDVFRRVHIYVGWINAVTEIYSSDR